jgi:uncharacterized membrane protein
MFLDLFFLTLLFFGLTCDYSDLLSKRLVFFTLGVSNSVDALMARRNALLAQQKRNLRQENVLNREIRLPQEWTY